MKQKEKDQGDGQKTEYLPAQAALLENVKCPRGFCSESFCPKSYCPGVFCSENYKDVKKP